MSPLRLANISMFIHESQSTSSYFLAKKQKTFCFTSSLIMFKIFLVYPLDFSPLGLAQVHHLPNGRARL